VYGEPEHLEEGKVGIDEVEAGRAGYKVEAREGEGDARVKQRLRGGEAVVRW
jgi:hypothetical protein